MNGRPLKVTAEGFTVRFTFAVLDPVTFEAVIV